MYWDSGISVNSNKELVFREDFNLNSTRVDSLASSSTSLYLVRQKTEDTTPKPLLIEPAAASEGSLNSNRILSDDPSVNWLISEGKALGGSQSSQVFEAGNYSLWIQANNQDQAGPSEIQRIDAIANTIEIQTDDGLEYRLNVQVTGVLKATGDVARCSITVKRLGRSLNGFAFYPVDAATGGVRLNGQTLSPLEPGYTDAAFALASASQLVFEGTDIPDYGEQLTLENISLRPGTDYGILFFDEARSNFYASVSAANPSASVQVQSFLPTDSSQLIFGLEDIDCNDPLSDRDFNDLILVIDPQPTPTPVAPEYNYVIGSLFPMADGQPNVITSSSIHYDAATKAFVGDSELGSLETEFNVTTAPVQVPGMSKYLSRWLIPQMIDTANPNSLFNAYLGGVIGAYTKKTRANSLTNLKALGYNGLDFDQGANSNAYFSSLGNKDDRLYAEIQDLNNYNPSTVWSGYNPLETDNIVASNFDEASLLANLAGLSDLDKQSNPPLWYPSILYSYQKPGAHSTIPGPVLLLRPGEELSIAFKNDIQLGNLNLEQAQQSTYVPISTYGNTASSGLGGVTTTNFHLHGMHINPEGFGDNVIGRYTTGQSWTTVMALSQTQAEGSYWYHPHYHPSVNGQLYGGLAGFLELGDTLGKIPFFKKTPRNLVELKNLQLGFRDGQVVLAGYDNGLPVNQMVMTTVNGEFQPDVDAGAGGWQSFSLSNMTNGMFYNIRFRNNHQTLPLYIYGEDGHQLPQIRWASQGSLGSESANPSNSNPNNTLTVRYTQAENLISLAPGKRIDILVYLPQGTTEIDSFYSFQETTGSAEDTTDLNILNMGTYPDLSSTNTITDPSDAFNLGQLGPGQLATLTVNQAVPALSKAQQDELIDAANSGIKIQDILPTTLPWEVDPEAVPSINLFAKNAQGDAVWKPIRQREFNWARGTLVGPKQDYDAATQQELARIEALPEFQARDYHYKRYRPLPIQGLLNGLGTSDFLTSPESWLGYKNPFLINDHVFPNGNLIIAQIATVEEWTLANWSVAATGLGKRATQSNQYIGHPFHIHINDFQVENSDTELKNKRNLEDVTMINSSGYKYFNISADPISGKPRGIVEQQPLEGSLLTIDEALKADTVTELATYGANTQTVKMMFQDYLGAYVFHCHIIPHEDAGMMQAIMVIDNTKWSWLIPAEGVVVTHTPVVTPDPLQADSIEQRFGVRLASNLEPFSLSLQTEENVNLERFQVGDLNRDFIQDLLVTSSGDGSVRMIDGRRLLDSGITEVTSTLVPYQGVTLAPWAFVDDVTGDGSKDIVTGGFEPVAGANRAAGTVNLHDFTIKGWSRSAVNEPWQQLFALNPWETISHHDHAESMLGEHESLPPSLSPVTGLTVDQTGFSVGDFNLDNFVDYAMAYAIDAGLRITIIDGAALSLALQTGAFEGGYDPNKALLADALLLDDSLDSLSHVVLTNGFNGYGQNAIENLLVTAQTASGSKLFTLALDAGHFIATSEPLGAQSNHHGMSVRHPLDGEHIINLESTNYPLHLHAIDQLPEGVSAATPVFSGIRANGSMLVEDRLLIAQGNGANGTNSTSDQLINTAQQLVIDLSRVRTVDEQDLVGVTNSNASTTFTPIQVEARNNLANMVFTTYCGGVVTPGIGAFWAGASLGQGDSVSLMVEQFLADPLTGQLVEDHFDGPLAEQSVSSIVEITSQTLYGRAATAAETARAELAVAAGVSKSELPLFLLQNTEGVDRHRVALLSAYSQWSNAQWGTDANVIGSYGQGLRSDQPAFDVLQQSVTGIGVIGTWQQAQDLFDGLQAESTQLLGGTPISPSGSF